MSGIVVNGMYMNVPYAYNWLNFSDGSNKMKQSYIQGYHSPYYNGTGSSLQGKFILDETTGDTVLIYVPPYYLKGFVDISGNLIVRNQNLYIQSGNILLNGNLYVSGRIFDSLTPTNNNTFLGNSSMKNIQTLNPHALGQHNTAFGYYSLHNILNGSNNTALGNNSGNGLISENFNTFIGNNTGITNLNCNHSTAIGYGSNITQSNQIIVGTSNENVYVPGGMNVYANILINGNIALVNRNALYIYSDKTNSNFKSTNDLIFADNQNNEVIRLKDGKIGINNSTPNYEFDVNTMTRFNNPPFMVGTNIYSGKYNDGTFNTGVGLKSLSKLTTGARNTAYGPFSCVNLATGSTNTFFGSYAGHGLGNDEDNTGMGYYCMKDLSSSTYKFTHNAAFGANSMNSIIGTIISNVDYNSAFGSYSMNYFNGMGNTAFGYSSNNKANGNENTVYGSNAMNFSSANNAANNCVFGANSLSGFNTMTTGTINNNTVFGHSSLMGNTYNGSVKSTVNYNSIFGGNIYQRVDAKEFQYNTVFGNYIFTSTNSDVVCNYNTVFGYNSVSSVADILSCVDVTIFGSNNLSNTTYDQNFDRTSILGYNCSPTNVYNRLFTVLGSNCCQQLNGPLNSSSSIPIPVGIIAIGSDANNPNITDLSALFVQNATRNICLGAKSLPACDGTNNMGIGYNSGYNIHVNVDNDSTYSVRLNNTFIGVNSGHGMYTSTKNEDDIEVRTEDKTTIGYCTAIGSNLSLLSNYGKSLNPINYGFNEYSVYIGGYGGNVYIPGKLWVGKGITSRAPLRITSDYRIKKNVKKIDGNITIDNLKPIKFYNKITNKNDFGVIAHEAEKDFSCLVRGVKDGPELQTVNYNGFIAVNTTELQNLKKEITSMKKIMEQLWKKIEFIKTQKNNFHY